MSGSYLSRSSYLLAALATLSSAPAMAQDVLGYAAPGEISLQQSVTPIMDSITAFHDGLLIWIISGITLFVLALMVFVMVRFNRRANPTANRFSHNTLVEVVWVVVPVIILLVIAAPSFAVLSDQLTVPDGQRKYLGPNIFSFGEVEVPAAELTIKATGVQWYWDYAYPDLSEDGFSSVMLQNNERVSDKPNQPRLLAVDNELVVPVNTTVKVLVTSEPTGVIHSFAVPSFGIKIDAVPGRVNETWFNVRKTGIYYGQCSELCGKDHAFMPIAVRVVEKDEFARWIEAYKADGVDAANKTLSPVT